MDEMIPVVAALLEKGLSMIGNAVLSKGKDVVEEKLGIKLGDTVSPEQALALRQAEFEHEEWLIDAGIRQAQQSLEETKIYLADVADARGMQKTALGQDDIFVRRFVYYFATVIFAFTCCYITAITFIDIPEKSVRFADTTQGFLLGTILATVMNFFFGTSKSSQAKDNTINELTKTLKKES